MMYVVQIAIIFGVVAIYEMHPEWKASYNNNPLIPAGTGIVLALLVTLGWIRVYEWWHGIKRPKKKHHPFLPPTWRASLQRLLRRRAEP